VRVAYRRDPLHAGRFRSGVRLGLAINAYLPATTRLTTCHATAPLAADTSSVPFSFASIAHPRRSSMKVSISTDRLGPGPGRPVAVRAMDIPGEGIADAVASEQDLAPGGLGLSRSSGCCLHRSSQDLWAPAGARQTLPRRGAQVNSQAVADLSDD
jgi:hypothetical protein